jgi:hypothetical protein
MDSLTSNVSVCATRNLFMLISTISYNYSSKFTAADAISKIIDEMFVKQKIAFNIATSQNPKVNMDILLMGIARNNLGNFSYKTHRINENREKKPTVFLTQDISELDNVHFYIKNFLTRTNYSTSLRYLIYCEELTLENYKTTIRPNMLFDKNSWFHHVNSYYAIDSSENVTLVSYFVRNNSLCVGSTQNPYMLNREVAATFDKKSSRWIEDLEKLKRKWMNEDLKGLKLLAYLLNGTLYDFYKNKLTGEYSGVLVDVMNTVGQKYQMNIIYNINKLHKIHEGRTNGDIMPIITLSTSYLNNFVTSAYHLTSTYTEEVYRVVITPPESYSSYEKLAMPFDKTTWVLLGLTFGAAFAVTVIINRQSRWI